MVLFLVYYIYKKAWGIPLVSEAYHSPSPKRIVPRQGADNIVIKGRHLKLW